MKCVCRGIIVVGYFKILFVFMFFILGMVVVVLVVKGEFDMLNIDVVFVVMVKDVLFVGVKGIVIIGFICVLVVLLVVFFNLCVIFFIEDFYKFMFKNKSEVIYVMVGCIVIVVVVIFGMVWIFVMMSFGSFYDYL